MSSKKLFLNLGIIFFLTPITNVFANTSDYEAAFSAYEKNQLDDAYIHLKNSLQQSPNHLPSKVLMGKVLSLSFYYDDAILEFEEALQAGVDPNLVIEYLANSFLMEQEYNQILALSDRGLSNSNRAILYAIQAKAMVALDIEGANAKFNDAIGLVPQNAHIANAYSEFLLNQNKFDEAQTILESTLINAPENTETMRLFARYYKQMENQDQYIEMLERAIRLDAQQPLVLRELVSAYIKLGKLDLAHEVLIAVLSMANDDPMAKLLLSYVVAEQGHGEQAETQLTELVNQLSLIDENQMKSSDTLTFISAMSNYALGNLKTAKQNFNQYLRAQPYNLQASLLLAEIYQAERNYVAAINILEKFEERAKTDIAIAERLCQLYSAIEANHKCTWLVTQLASHYAGEDRYIALKSRAYAARGRIKEARDTIKQIKSETDTIIVEKALLALEANDLTQAEQHTKRLLKQSPDSSDYKNLLASIYVKANKLGMAQVILNEILNVDPQHFSARYNLASLLFQQGQTELSQGILSQLLNERPDQSNLLMLSARIGLQKQDFSLSIEQLSKVLRQDESNNTAQMLMIDAYSLNKQYEEALKIANRLVKENFLNPRYLTRRAELHINAQEFTKAINDIDKLKSIYAENPSGLLSSALLYERSGALNNAISSLNTALELSPDNYYIKREKTRLLIANAKFSEASQLLDGLSKQFSSDPDVMMLRGDLARATGQADKAANYYDKSLSLNQTFAAAMIKRYQLAISGTDPSGFSKRFEILVENTPSDALARNLLADFYLSQGELSQAKSHYLTILKSPKQQNVAMVLNNLAYIYQQDKSFDTAYEYAQKANNIMPNQADILDTLGWSLVLLGKYEEGLAHLRQAFVLNTADPGVRYHIGVALSKLQRHDDAKRELRQLLTNFEYFKQRAEAEALLASIS